LCDGILKRSPFLHLIAPAGVIGISSIPVFGHLNREVIKKNICTLCGACVASCPVDSVEITDETPKLTGICVRCGMCYSACPRTEDYVGNVEKTLFGREREEGEAIGIFKEIYTARTLLDDVRKKCQDGGIVTTLLVYALENGLIDAAVVSGRDPKEPWKPVPMVALTREEIINAAGTRYSVSPNVSALGMAVKEYFKSKVGFVGTPCQVLAVRKLQYHPAAATKIGERVAYVIGLFCMENFSYAPFIKKFIGEEKGIPLSEVTKFSIEKGKFYVYKGDTIALEMKVSELKNYARPACHVCPDLTAELADISVGSIGSDRGWSTVVIRTDKGKELFEAAVEAKFIEAKKLSLEDKGVSLLMKIASEKRKRAKK